MSDQYQIPRSRRGLSPEVAIDLGDLFHHLSHDKKTRKKIAAAVKELAPDSPYAAQFADIENQERQEEWERKQEERELKRQQEAAVARMQAQRDLLLTGGEDGKGRKYSEDDLKKIESMMQSKGLIDYNDGAVLYAATLPPDSPQRPNGDDLPKHGATYEFPEWAKFGKDPVGASRDTAHNVITEFMRGRR